MPSIWARRPPAYDPPAMTQAQAPTAPDVAIAPLNVEPAASRRVLVRALVALAAPVLAEHALHIIVGLTDTYLANHLPSDKAEATAAVGTVGYIFWFIGLFAGAIGTVAMDMFLFSRYRRGGGERGLVEWESSAGLTSWDSQLTAAVRTGGVCVWPGGGPL